jgi:hypothetical protein
MLTQFKQKRVKYDPSTYTRDYHKDKQCFSIVGGQKTSVPPIELEDYKLSNMYNCYYVDNYVASRFGYKSFGNGLPLPNPIVTIKQFTAYDGSTYLCIFTTKNVYKYNTSTKCFDLITDHTDVCDCEDAWTASAKVTATASTDWFRYGSKSAKIVIADDFTTGLAAYKNFSSIDLTTRTYLHLYIKSTLATAAGDLQILLDDTNDCASPLETIDVPALEAGVAKEINIAIADPSKLTAVISVGLKVITDLGANTIYIDQIESPTCFTGVNSDKFSTDTIYDTTDSEVKYLATNFSDVIQAWNASGNFAPLAGTPNKAKYLKNYYNYLITAYCQVSSNDFPTRVEWSVNTKPEDMTGAGSGNNSLTSQAGKIQMLEEIQGQLAILRENAITNMFIVAGVYDATQTPYPFEFSENKINNVGTPTGWSVQSLGDKLIFLGWDGVYIYDLYSFKNINSENFTKFIQNVNPEQLGLCFSTLLKENNLYLLFVPSTGATETDTVWVFDYIKEICLGTWKFHDSMSAAGNYKATSAEKTIGDLLETIGTFTWKIGDSKPEGLFSAILFGDLNGYVYEIDKNMHNDNGYAIESYFDTKAYCIKVGVFMRVVLTLVKMIGVEIEVLTSTNNGDTFVSKKIETAMPEDNEVKVRTVDVTTESVIFRFKCSTLNAWFMIMGWVLRFIEKDKVR